MHYDDHVEVIVKFSPAAFLRGVYGTRTIHPRHQFQFYSGPYLSDAIMPRSFMITHRRFGEDDLNILYSNSSNVERGSELSDDRMHPDSPARSYMSYVPDSPEFNKRAVFPHRGLEKSVSVSDGESDSGCSSQTDARHDLPSELEYSLNCPSGFSVLLELMTHSSHRYSNRDILDLNIFSEVKSTGQKFEKNDSDKVDLDIGKIKTLEICPITSGHIDRIENSNMHIHFCPENDPGLKVLDPRRYVFESSENRKGFADCVVYSSDRDFPVSVGKNCGHETNGTRGIQISSQTTPVYDFQIYSGNESKMNHIQRRISFDEDVDKVHTVKTFSASDSTEDQPIDYSQLSSRRKETCNEWPIENAHAIGQEVYPVKEEPNIKARRMSEAIYSTTKKINAGPAPVQKYEFILSPKMDGNGNLVLSQPPKANSKTLEVDQGQEHAVKGNEPLHSRPHTSNYAQQSSPLSATPASPLHFSSDSKQGTALDIAKAKFEPQKQQQENAAGINKARITYHPKLKYLLAVSQYAKNKSKQEDEPIPSATKLNPYPSYQQSMLFSHDQNAQAEKFVKNSDPNENVYTRSEVGHHRIPSSEKFHTLNNAPNCNLDNAGVFILNPAPTFQSCASFIDNSNGSSAGNKQHTNADINSSQPSSLPTSNTFNGSRTSDVLQCENALDNPCVVYPSSPGEPLSPASLRDQQVALSELLFSADRKSGVDPYACIDCAKRYSTSSNLARHRQTHRSVCDKKARKCPHCDKVYVSMPAYSMHVRTHNQGCECPHCGKKFSRPWLLQGHIRTHTGEKPFGCPQCGKSFADKSNLRAHIQTHSTDKPYVCGRCGKAFALKSYLYKHEESSCMRGQRFRH